MPSVDLFEELESCRGAFRGVLAYFDETASDLFFKEIEKNSQQRTARNEEETTAKPGQEETEERTEKHKENEQTHNLQLNSQAAVLEYASGLAMFGAQQPQQMRRSQIRRSQAHSNAAISQTSQDSNKAANASAPAPIGPVTRSRSRELQLQQTQKQPTNGTAFRRSGITAPPTFNSSTPTPRNGSATDNFTGTVKRLSNQLSNLHISGTANSTGGSLRVSSASRRPTFDRVLTGTAQRKNVNGALDNGPVPTKSQFFRDAHNRDQSLGRSNEQRERVRAPSPVAVPRRPLTRPHVPVRVSAPVRPPTNRSASLPRNNTTTTATATAGGGGGPKPAPTPRVSGPSTRMVTPRLNARAPVRVPPSNTTPNIGTRANPQTRIPTQPKTMVTAARRENTTANTDADGQKRESVFDRLYKPATPRRVTEQREHPPAVRPAIGSVRRAPSMERRPLGTGTPATTARPGTSRRTIDNLAPLPK